MGQRGLFGVDVAEEARRWSEADKALATRMIRTKTSIWMCDWCNGDQGIHYVKRVMVLFKLRCIGQMVFNFN